MTIPDNCVLSWQQLQPVTHYAADLFQQATSREHLLFPQARLQAGLSLFCSVAPKQPRSRVMFVKAKESPTLLSAFEKWISQHRHMPSTVIGSRYEITGTTITRSPATQSDDNFAATTPCVATDWVEETSLFGYLTDYNGHLSLTPGLIHHVNGGVLLLSARTLLMQPLLWQRLKQCIITQQHHWFSLNKDATLAVAIPPMPVDLNLIIVGDAVSLSDFQEFEPELFEQTIYGEYEKELTITSEQNVIDWLSLVKSLSTHYQLPQVDEHAAALLLKTAVRETGDKYTLPLNIDWLLQQLTEATQFAADGVITESALDQALTSKAWRENYLAEKSLEQIYHDLIHIDTHNAVIGQVNALSVIEYPGHPRAFGEPSRISCLLQSGSGEFTDIDRQSELGGNVHNKGMLIIQSLIASELAIEHTLPFSASLVFEQSYSEVDGDSASLAAYCAYMSALASYPLNQQLAVTGSVDQRGNVQAVGGINEKIESFFVVCRHFELTGQQGVIIPHSNIRHLCLSNELVDAVKNGQFHLYTVNNVTEALEILTGISYKSYSHNADCLLEMIQQRIQRMLSIDKQLKLPNFLKWLKS